MGKTKMTYRKKIPSRVRTRKFKRNLQRKYLKIWHNFYTLRRFSFLEKRRKVSFLPLYSFLPVWNIRPILKLSSSLPTTKSTQIVCSPLVKVDFSHRFCFHLVIFNSNRSSLILSYSESWLGASWDLSWVLSSLPKINV